MHHHGLLHKPIEWASELFSIAGEFLWEMVETPHSEQRRGAFFLMWGSVGVALILSFFIIMKEFVVDTAPFKQALWLVYRSYPLWLPLLLFKLFIELWIKYIRADFTLRRNAGVLLEVRVPREIEKTPKSMELLMMALWETGSVEYNETYWDGKVRPWWSFEIASFGGDVRFFIWTFPKYRNVLESQIYAQYPTVEIVDADDYAKQKVYDPPRNFMWGTYFKFLRPDVYPIMTYIDYGLDKETEEEYKVDPLSTIIEYLGSITPGEEIWLQILAQAYRPFTIKEAQLLKRKDWTEEAQEEINKIMKRDPHTKSTRQFTQVGYPIVPTLTEWEKKQAEAIERSINKRAYWCQIRALYHAERHCFHLLSPRVSGLLGTFRKPFNSNLLNGFKLGWYTDISDPVKDFFFLFGLKDYMIRKFQPLYARQMLDAYRRRSFFYAPYKNWQASPLILTVEELATMYHFPGQVVTTPTFGRIPSKKVEPPANLPV